MRVEVKKRFLVTGEGWRSAVAGISVLRDGLLAESPDRTIRVRLDGARAWLTVMGARTGLRRVRFDYEIPVPDAWDLLVSQSQGHPIERRRHQVPHAGCVWAVDVYVGTLAGLVMAEIELDDEDHPFERPGWIGADVSEDQRYRKTALLQSARSSIGRPLLIGTRKAILEI